MDALLLLVLIFAPVFVLYYWPAKKYNKRNTEYWTNPSAFRTKPLKITYWNN